MNATSSGFISGAASGAATGASFGPYGAVIGGVIGGVLGGLSGSNTDKSHDNQQQWAEYANNTRYNTTMANLEIQSMVAMANAGSALAMSTVEANATRAVAGRNAELIRGASIYNASLLDQEIEYLWEEAELDISQLGVQRARERGDIIAAQGASGTVIGVGSNKDIVVAQRAMEAFDEFVIRHQADVRAGKIADARALGLWQGEVAARQTEWQGNLSATMGQLNTRAQVAGMLLSTGMSNIVGRRDAGEQLLMGGYGIQQNQSQYSFQNNQNLVSGLFSAAGTMASVYASGYTPSSGTVETFKAAPLSGNWHPYGTMPGNSLMVA